MRQTIIDGEFPKAPIYFLWTGTVKMNVWTQLPLPVEKMLIFELSGVKRRLHVRASTID